MFSAIYIVLSSSASYTIPYPLLPELFLLGDQSLRFKSSHTPAAGTRDRLSIPLILDITRRKDALDRGLCGSRDSDDVAVSVGLQLGANEGSGGFVT